MVSARSIMAIALVFLVGGTVAATAFNLLGQAEDAKEGTGRLEIKDRETFHKLIFYDTLIAYNCDSSGGGRNRLPSWAEFRDVESTSFQKLREAGSKLDCKGTDITVPLSGTTAEETPTVKKVWRNDQEGRFSKKEFIIKEDIELTGRPFGIKHEGQSQSLFIRPKPPDEKNHFFPRPNDINYLKGTSTSGGFVSVESFPEEGFYPNDPEIEDLVIASLTIFTSDKNYGATEKRVRVNGEAPFANTARDAYKFRFCKGSKGYIQTNTGVVDSTSYSIGNPPGEDRERGEKDNYLHPFIVITKDTCEEAAEGALDEGDVFNARDGNWYGDTLKFGIVDSSEWWPDGFATSLDRFTWEDQDRKITAMKLKSIDSSDKCKVRTDDGDGRGKITLYEEGHIIDQEDSIAGNLNPVERKNGEDWSLEDIRRHAESDRYHTSSHERQLVFSQFDSFDMDPIPRRRAGQYADLAIERYFAKDSGRLKDDRFMARPEGDLICADYNPPDPNEESKVRWVKCGHQFISVGDTENDNDAEDDVLEVNPEGSEETKYYRCEKSDNYREDGQASWVEVSPVVDGEVLDGEVSDEEMSEVEWKRRGCDGGYLCGADFSEYDVDEEYGDSEGSGDSDGSRTGDSGSTSDGSDGED